jgi:hypothetical protein
MAVDVVLTVLQVDDTHDTASAQQGHRQKRFVFVFRQLVEKLETRILGSSFRHGNQLAVLRHP